jgi:hypothetical protein
MVRRSQLSLACKTQTKHQQQQQQHKLNGNLLLAPEEQQNCFKPKI